MKHISKFARVKGKGNFLTSEFITSANRIIIFRIGETNFMRLFFGIRLSRTPEIPHQIFH